MYAIIRAGGKQAKVKAGDVIEIERLKDIPESLSFTPLMVVGEDGSTVTDRDVLSGATVAAEILGETKGEKIDIFKYKNKTGYRRHMGHRQTYTQIRVTSIDVPGAKPAKAAKTPAPEVTSAEPSTEAPVAKAPVAKAAPAKAPAAKKAAAKKAAPDNKAPAEKAPAKKAAAKKAPAKKAPATKKTKED
jgi:large subunit ribosomal protein L21